MTREKNDMNAGQRKNEIPPAVEKNLLQVFDAAGLKKFTETLFPEFTADAREGLKNVADNEQLSKVVRQLNHQLHQQLAPKKQFKRARSIKGFKWGYWGIVLVLFLAILAFVMVRMLLHRW